MGALSSNVGGFESAFVTIGILSILITGFLIIVSIDEPFYEEAMRIPRSHYDALAENIETLALGVGNVPVITEEVRPPANDTVIGGPLLLQIPGQLIDAFTRANPLGFIQGFVRFVGALFGFIINGILSMVFLSIALFVILAEVPLGLGMIFGTISAFVMIYFLAQFLTFFIGSVKPI